MESLFPLSPQASLFTDFFSAKRALQDIVSPRIDQLIYVVGFLLDAGPQKNELLFFFPRSLPVAGFRGRTSQRSPPLPRSIPLAQLEVLFFLAGKLPSQVSCPPTASSWEILPLEVPSFCSASIPLSKEDNHFFSPFFAPFSSLRTNKPFPFSSKDSQQETFLS